MSKEPQSTDADVGSAAFLDSDRKEGDHASPSLRAVMINRPRDELYAAWRDLERLPRFMENVKSVRVIDDARSTWVIAGPAGKDIDLDSLITEDVPGERIAWTSAEGSDIDHEGWVSFKDNAFGRGTEVRLFITYDPPAGVVGKVVAKVLQRETKGSGAA